MQDIFHNVEKLKNKRRGSLVLSPLPFRSFQMKQIAPEYSSSQNQCQEEDGHVRITRRDSGMVGEGIAAGLGTLGNQRRKEQQPYRQDKDSRPLLPQKRKELQLLLPMEEQRTHREEHMESDTEGSLGSWEDEELFFPHMDSVGTPTPVRVKDILPEEEEQVCRELVSIFQEKDEDTLNRTPVPLGWASSKLFRALQSDEDLANMLTDFSSPPPRASNPITQNKSFGRGAGVLPEWEVFEEDDEDEFEEAEDEYEEAEDSDEQTVGSLSCRGREGIFRSCSAPAISL